MIDEFFAMLEMKGLESHPARINLNLDKLTTFLNSLLVDITLSETVGQGSKENPR